MSKEIDKKMIKVERQLIGELRNILTNVFGIYEIYGGGFHKSEEDLKCIGDLVVKLTDVIHSDLTSFTPKEQVKLYGEYNPFTERIITEHYKKKEEK
jgi:hypothetical protein